jgi:MFS family permease
VSESYTPPPNGFRTFSIVWATQSVSVFGSALTGFAMNIWLLVSLYPRPEQKPELAAALSAINLTWAAATVFSAPLAGAWADRHDRKRTMMAMDFVSGLVSLLLAALVLLNLLSVVVLIPVLFMSALVGAFHGSAFDTSYAMLVPKERLPRANGMMQTTGSLAGILAPGIAAAIIGVPAMARQGLIPGASGAFLAGLPDGTALAMGLDALTFFGAAATLLFLQIPSPRRTDLQVVEGQRRKSIWKDIWEGVRYIWLRRPLLWLLGTFTVCNLLSAPMGVLIPLLVRYNLQPDWAARGFTIETAMALLGTVGSIGGTVGGVIISAWGGLKRRRVYGVVVPILVLGLVLVVYGLSPFLYLAAAMAFLESALIPAMNSHSQSIWQTQTPHELQGRVFAVRRLIAQVSWPLGTLAAGILGAAVDPGLAIAVLGAIMALFCAGQLFNPILLRVEDKEYLDGLAAQQEGT